MATIAENLQTIKDSTDAIKQAIIDKGGTISGDITTWASAISGIESGGGSSSNGPGSVFKITNKLNGQLFGGPTYVNSDMELLHTYSFEGGNLASITILPIDPVGNFPGMNGGIVSDSGDYDGTVNEWFNSFSSFTVWSVSGQYCGVMQVKFFADGRILVHFYGTNYYESTIPLDCLYIAADELGNYDIDRISFQGGGPCFLKDTKITLSDNSYKLVQNITYNDELLVWNFDEGKYDKAKPLWIKKAQTSAYYYKVTLDDNIVINLMGSGDKCHRLFSIEDNMFISATDMVGKTTYTINGHQKVISCELIEEKCEYYNIITDYHINLFANDILTSCRYNNIYPIQDMKFIKDDRLNRAPRWKLYEQFRDYKCLGRYIEGMRLYEQLDIPLKDTIKYCERLESLRKTLDEFECNEELLRNIDETEVGWIDRKGDVYGFKHYMPGQYNHIILADKICKELNIQTDNPSRHLEKLGWVKYTTDFILNSNDEYINKEQLKTLKKFLKVPKKLKKEGFIKIGTIYSDYTDISDFENMDEYSFEMRKKNSNKNNYKKWQQDK